MANLMLGFPVRSDAATLSDGSWSGSLPITNMQDRRIGKKARTADAANASTKINISYPTPTRIKLACLANHNLSIDSTYRIRASNEASATNLLTYSEQFDNAAWTKYNVAALANQITAPDGNLTCDKITESSIAVIQKFFLMRTGVIVESSTNVVSVFLQKGERQYARVYLSAGNGTASGIWTTADLNLGTVSSVTLSGAAVSGGATITQYDDFYRVSVYGVLASDVTQAGLLVYILDESLAHTYAGVVGYGLYSWGAQLESGSTASSYYPTTADAATRPHGYIDTWQSYDYDSGVLPVWPALYTTLELEWEDDNWWSGSIATEDRAGYTWTLIHIFNQNLYMKQYKIDLFDSANTDGYVEIGRLFMSPAYQPTKNIGYGESIGYEPNTKILASPSGIEYFDAQNNFRVARFSLNFIDTDEAMSNVFEMQRKQGDSEEILYIFDPDDVNHKLRRSFLGRMRGMSPIEQPYLSLHQSGFEIKELL